MQSKTSFNPHKIVGGLLAFALLGWALAFYFWAFPPQAYSTPPSPLFSQPSQGELYEAIYKSDHLIAVLTQLNACLSDGIQLEGQLALNPNRYTASQVGEVSEKIKDLLPEEQEAYQDYTAMREKIRAKYGF